MLSTLLQKNEGRTTVDYRWTIFKQFKQLQKAI